MNTRSILVVLCLREKMYDEALENAQFLHGQYPRNFQLHLNVARILTEMNRPAQAADVYMKIITQAEARTPNYQKMPLGVFRYNDGSARTPEDAILKHKNTAAPEAEEFRHLPERDRIRLLKFLRSL